jgi:thiamine biosynthesis lipoprotein
VKTETLVPSQPLVSQSLRAMNSDIELMTAGPGATRRLARARRWLAAFEERFSRFRLLSELSRLNAASGRRFRASPAMCRLVDIALGYARRSEGLFDPTVLPLLDAAGYDCSFEQIDYSHRRGSPPQARFSWCDVELSHKTHTIRMPEGCGIDLGGIGKGWAVDRMAAILGQTCLVNGGGDIYAGVRPDAGSLWRVGVADPFAPDEDFLVIGVENRGVATSSTLKRRWLSDGMWAHHLIDPRTQRPSASNAVQVTAIAPSAIDADYHAKVALLLGVEDGIDYLDAQPDVEGLIFRSDGQAYESRGFGEYQEPELPGPQEEALAEAWR